MIAAVKLHMFWLMSVKKYDTAIVNSQPASLGVGRRLVFSNDFALPSCGNADTAAEKLI